MNATPTALIAEDEPLLAENLRAELAGLWPELQIVAMAAHGQAAVDPITAQFASAIFTVIMLGALAIAAVYALRRK